MIDIFLTGHDPGLESKVASLIRIAGRTPGPLGPTPFFRVQGPRKVSLPEGKNKQGTKLFGSSLSEIVNVKGLQIQDRKKKVGKRGAYC